jgi:diguanylate cyclase (GGDEF)-like protein
MKLTQPTAKIKDAAVHKADGEEYKSLHESTIMMVDDEPITMEIIQTYLEEAGYGKFILIEDSTKAMDVIETSRLDLLLLDLSMPEVTGFDILREVRENTALKHLPVIILTASSDPNDKLLALENGATDFLSKPVDPSELILRVRNTLSAKAYQDQLAYYDPVTNLPNRQMFIEHLEWALNTAKRDKTVLAVLSIEIDQFNRFSDTIGISLADEILRTVARRFKNDVRAYDVFSHFAVEGKPEITLSRFERGIFTLLLHRIRSEKDAAHVAERILDSVREPVTVGNTECHLTACIGIATYPSEDTTGVEMLRLASNARDYTRGKGKNSFAFCSSEINTKYMNRLKFEARLRRALNEDEFILYYQPKVDVKTGIIKGAEALLRWPDGSGGFIPPSAFIPVLEESELIISFGKWIISRVCNDWKTWCRAGKNPVGTALNLSPKQFEDPGLFDEIVQIIKHTRMDPRFLTLEITEGMLIEDIDNKIELMKRLRNLGLKIAIDDFGTGYSSLSYLKKLPVDELKIDRSFITDLSKDSKSRALLSSVIGLSRNLGLYTVAEGVETKKQLHFLQQQGCDLFQGYLFSPAVPNNKFVKLIDIKGNRASIKNEKTPDTGHLSTAG